ncbi:helix-turn-helix transcriptional regulator [Priestia sp. FSL W8-0524]|uniref:helix-turn-helix domain-containing protein n=1 Tax=Priestia sp. FSL W8-0524 TaxID=2954625 RepID=UPI0030F9B32C
MNKFDSVRSRRKELGLTQKQLATKASVSLSVVQQLEGGKPYNPKSKNFFKVAKALEVEIDLLLFGCAWPEGKEL